MVKKFEEFINEGILSKTLNRSKNGEIRKEDGQKVMTSLGVEIVLHNPDCNYEEIITNLFDGSVDDWGFDFTELDIFSNDEKINIRNGEIPYSQLLNKYLVVAYPTYEDAKENELIDEYEVSKDDYISIINGVTQLLKTTDIEKLPRDARRDKNREYCFLLMSESNVSDYEYEMDDYYRENWIDDLKGIFEDSFSGDDELVFYSYHNYSCAIGVTIYKDSFVNLSKYKDLVKSYLEGTKEEENEEEE